AGAVHDGDLLLVALVLGAAGDVLDRAVAVVGVDGELLLVVAGHDPVVGVDRDARDHGVGGRAVGQAGGDPAADEAVLVGVLLHALAAAVGQPAGRLVQQQAVVRGGREH